MVRCPVKVFLAAAAVSCLAAACVPTVNNRGYIPDPAAIAGVAKGQDSKDTVVQKLGNPSTASEFGADTWFYISDHQEQEMFYKPVVTERQILAVQFDKDGKVNDLHTYTLADGHVVDIVTRETPTRGRELTLLQQIFNAQPGLPAAAAGNDQGGGDDDSGQ